LVWYGMYGFSPFEIPEGNYTRDFLFSSFFSPFWNNGNIIKTLLRFGQQGNMEKKLFPSYHTYHKPVCISQIIITSIYSFFSSFFDHFGLWGTQLTPLCLMFDV